jgi:hypothetical protein
LVFLVVPDARHFSWNQREGWEVAFRRADIPFSSVGIGPKPTKSQLHKISSSDLVIFLNDHHLEPLFSTFGDPAKRFSKNSDGLWIGVSTERVENSPFPRSVEKTRLAASFCQFTAFFDRSAEPVIRSAGSMPFFIHQYVDHHTFRSEQPYPAKKPQVFWTGKLPAGHTQGEYGVRTRLFESLRGRPGFAWREAYKPDLSIQQTVRERDGFQGLLHLPSNCPGYTSTFFENLAMGGCVIQYDAGPEYALPDLKAGEHYLSYDANRPETLLEAVETFLRNPASFQTMAEEGKRLCLQNHTIHRRLEEIFLAIQGHLGTGRFPAPASPAGQLVAGVLEKLGPKSSHSG